MDIETQYLNRENKTKNKQNKEQQIQPNKGKDATNQPKQQNKDQQNQGKLQNKEQ